MSKILVIDSSSRGVGSVSRAMTQQFIKAFSEGSEDSCIVYRDLVKSSLPHLSADAIEGFFSPEPSLRAKRATVVSDQLIAELMEADLVCLGMPVYNFNVPSAMKAYIDQVVRIGRTFQKVGDGNLEGLCRGKRMLVLYSMGGIYQGSEMDFVRPYMKVIADFMGFESCDFVAIEGTSRGGFSLDERLAEASESIDLYLAEKGLLEAKDREKAACLS
ncbi:NAD(P)H-dependent oxidoreductase [uncultured Neptuniibacter sp.]|uniref:FMN-dependent NADH-azoreductase n=1 Tax=uncultured Neptuniibacter sp. TaxID=502143 RepID=UPI0026216A00|nr:NAD(P)H-dependent oxidoreductase [uncultured Neptuniibacter sp.]